MKRSKFSDEQILAIVKEGKAVGRSRTCAEPMGSRSFPRPRCTGTSCSKCRSVSPGCRTRSCSHKSRRRCSGTRVYVLPNISAVMLPP
jgi:hypothetical protein